MCHTANRNEAAICHWAGPFAVQSIKEGVSLKHTVVERDGSHPVLTAEKGFESDTHAREPVFADRKFAHINLPREGESLEEKFRVQYINGTACDADFQIVLRTIDGSETVVVEQATLDGNRYDQHLSRPAVPAGQYSRSPLLFCQYGVESKVFYSARRQAVDSGCIRRQCHCQRRDMNFRR